MLLIITVTPLTESLIQSAETAIRSLASFFYARDMEEAAENLHVALTASDLDRRVYLARKGAQVVGIIGYRRRRDADRVYYLSFFGVADGHRGRGIGSLLLQRLEKDLSCLDARLLLAEAGDSSYARPARRFYESQGFVRVATVPDFWQEGDGLALYLKRLQRKDVPAPEEGES